MNYEESRLRTFESWPANAAVDARRIAKAGFYYMGRGLEVQCFSCGVRISEWNYGDKVMSRHRSLDPGCRFVQNPIYSGNVPMVNDTRRHQNQPEPDISQPSLGSAIPTHSRNSSSGVGNTMYQCEDTRTHSFSNWPIPFIISPELLVSSGFFYTQLGDKVQCAFCGLLVGRWEQGDIPDTEHLRHNPLCPFMMDKTGSQDSSCPSGIRVRDITSDKSGIQSLKELGVQSHRVPRHPKLSTYESRLRTYSLWPKGLSQKPEELSDAGFYFTGKGDQVRCFHCDGGLRLWEKTDIPWQEHARWFPDCGFVLLIKGQQFIDESIIFKPPKVHNMMEERGLFVKQTLPVNRVRTVSEEELHGLMNSPNAIAALQVGIEASRVKLALRQKMEQTGTSFSSADALIVAALDIHNEESQDIDETWATPPASPVLGWARVAPRRTHTDESSSDSSDHEDSESFNPAVNEGENASEETCSLKTNTETPGNKETGKLSLEEENRRLKEARLCKICMDNEVCVVFLPCGHLVTCVHCAHSLSDCPLCRQPIKATVRTFLS